MAVKASGANANLRLRGTAGDSETDINEEINGESTDANANVSLTTLSTSVGFDTADGGHKMSEFFGYSSAPDCTTDTWDVLNETVFPSDALYTLNSNSNDAGRSGWIGQGGIFNGSNSRIYTGSTFMNIQEFTVGGWFKFSNKTSSQVLIAAYEKSPQTTGDAGWMFRWHSTLGLNFGHLIGSTWGNSSVAWTPTQGEWYHLAMSRNSSGSAIKFYVNGIQQGTTQSRTGTLAYTQNGGTATFTIGGVLYNSSPDQIFKGNIDQIRAFDKVLSSSEIIQLAAENYVSSTKSTVDIFGDSSGLALYELEGNANDTGNTYNGTASNVTYSLNGTDTNVTYTTGKFGNAATFNGSSSKIALPSFGTTFRNNFSYSLWFKLDTLPSGGISTLIAVQGDYYNYAFIRDSEKKVEVRFEYASGGSDVLKSTTVFSDYGTWHHLVVTKSSKAGGAIYIDGVLEASDSTATSDLNATSTGNNLGVYGNGSQYWLDGQIDQLRIFDYGLDADKVTALYNESTSTPFDAYIDNSIKTSYYFNLNNNGHSVKASGYLSGQSANFNGSNSRIENVYQIDYDNSISMWLNVDNTIPTGTYYGLWTQGDGTGAYAGIRYKRNSGDNYTIEAFIRLGNDYIYRRNTSSTWNPGWNHFVFLVNSSTGFDFYLNGSNGNFSNWFVAGTFTNVDFSGQTAILAKYTTDTNTFKGQMDDVRFYSDLLTTAEIESLASHNTTSIAAINNFVAHYKLDGNANDSVGSNNGTWSGTEAYADPAAVIPAINISGTATDVDFDQGKYNNAAVFNGDTSKIITNLNTSDISTSSLGRGNFSVSFWVYQTAYKGHAPLINGYKASNNGWYIELQDGKIYTFIGDNSAVAYRRGYFNVVLNLSEWYHIAYDNFNNRVWLNGAEITHTFVDDSYSTVSNIGDKEIVIGHQYVQNTYYFDGLIDQIRFLKGPLLAEDVTKLYNEYQCACTADTVNYPITNAAFYKLNGNANDSTTNGYNASTASNITYTRGLFERTAVFNGSNSYIAASSSIISSPSSPYSFSLWFKKDSTNYKGIFMNMSATQRVGEIAVTFTNATTITIYTMNTAGSNRCDGVSATVPTMSTGVWYHLVVIADNSLSNNGQVYINGTEASSYSFLTNNANAGGTAGYTYIGTADAQYFDGSIDQVRIFENALTESQVVDLFNETSCRSTSVPADILGDNSVVAFFPMEDSVADATGTYTASSNGTLGFVDGKTGKSLQRYETTQGYIQTNINWLSGDNVSLSFWFKADKADDFNHPFLYADPNPGQTNENSAYIGHYTSTISNEIVSIGGWTSSGLCLYSAIGTSSEELFDNKWHFIVLTLGNSASDKKIYVDGVKKTIQNGSAFGSSLSRPLEFRNVRIGSYLTTSDGYKSDNWRFYNKILSDSEVLTIYYAEL